MSSFILSIGTFIGRTILSYLAFFVLSALGWGRIDQSYIRVNKYRRAIAIFSHTGYVDFYILALYLLAYPDELRHIKIAIKPQPFEYAGPILRWLGGIPVTRIQDTNGGATQRIVDELNKCGEFLFFISPKGTIEKGPWKSGYYHIAQGCKADLLVVGLDYERNVGCISESISYTESQAEIEAFLHKELSQIVPIRPECEVVQIRPHESRQIIRWANIGKYTFCIALVYVLRTYLV